MIKKIIKKKEVDTPKPSLNIKDVKEVLGECHDGDDYRLLMKDGTAKIVSKEDMPKSLLK